jgi:hypothetical protein
MKNIFLAASIALAFSAGAAKADAVIDAISAAQQAHTSGQLSQAATELSNAVRAIQAVHQQRLASILPQPSEGWTMALDESSSAAMGLFGGNVGIIVGANYSHSDGRSFKVDLMADSPMVASMAGMLGNPAMMAMMGTVVKVGTVDMVDDGSTLSTMIANRVLVQAQGASVEDMAATLSSMDFARLAQFDQ